MKKLIILLQFVLLFIAILPVLAMNNLSTVGDCVVTYKHDIWYSILGISIGVLLYAYFKFFINKWYDLEDYIIVKHNELHEFILNVQLWRRRIFFILFICLTIYVILFL